MKKAHVLIFNGYADWEIGYTLAEIRRIGEIEVVTVGFTTEKVLSMGGLQAIPHIALQDVTIDNVSLFLIPGGKIWESQYPQDIIPLIKRLASNSTPIAAICAATTLLARAGLLRGIKHTSNSKEYISEIVPEYSDHDTYTDTLASRDKHIITASGLGAIEFTLEVLAELNISTPQMRSMWYDAFKHGIFNNG